MQIAFIRIEHFRAFRELEADTSQLTKLVGANNAGKSTVLSAVEMFFDPSPKLTELDHHKRNTANPISITLEFRDLTPAEREEFGPAIVDGRLQITRELSCLEAEPRGYIVTAKLNPEFEEVRKLTGREKIAAYKELAITYDGQLPSARSAADVDKALFEWETENADRLSLQKSRGFFGATNVASGKLSKKTAVRLVPAVKEVAGEVRDAKKSPIIALLSDIARHSLENKEELSSAIEEANAKIGYLIDPTNFPHLQNISQNLTQSLVKYYKDCRIEADWASYSPVTFSTPIPRIQVESGGVLTPVERVGHGLQRAVLFSLIEYLAEQSFDEGADRTFTEPASDIILLIEEPEIYQHPSKQLTIAAALEKLCRGFSSVTGIRVQVILTTHSEKFVNLSSVENVRIVRRGISSSEQKASCRKCRISDVSRRLSSIFETPRTPFSDEKFISTLHIFTREVSEGFFAEKVVLVEGVSDKAAIQAAFSLSKRDPDAEGIAVIDVGGKSKIDKPFEIFRQLGIPVFAIFDNDKNKRDISKHQTKFNKQFQRLVGAESCLEYPEGVFSSYCALDEDLESCLRKSLGENQDEIYRQVRDEFGLDAGDVCKTPAVVRAVFSKGVAAGSEFQLFRDIISAIDNLK